MHTVPASFLSYRSRTLQQVRLRMTSCPVSYPRVVHVIFLHSAIAPKGLDLTFGGAWYPVDAKPAPQYFHLKLLCDTNAEELMVDFVSYNGTDLWLETKTPAGCPLRGPPQDDDKKPEDGGGDKGTGGEKEEEVGSGLGYFFLL